MLSSDSVWQRTEADPALIISDRLYNLTIGAVLLWGFLANYVIVQTVPLEPLLAIGPIPFFIGYIISSFAGIMIYTKSDDPWVSFFGYNLVVLPIGLMLAVTLPLYASLDPMLIPRAMAMTGAVTSGMMFLGGAFPHFFLSIGRTLGIALGMSLLIMFIMALTGSFKPGLFDGLFVVIFSGYIGYDWARANAIPKTFDNAVDSAASLYLDIINLFLTILRLMASSRD
jgi:FtsH-binding integral membrane protein